MPGNLHTFVATIGPRNSCERFKEKAQPIMHKLVLIDGYTAATAGRSTKGTLTGATIWSFCCRDFVHCASNGKLVLLAAVVGKILVLLRLSSCRRGIRCGSFGTIWRNIEPYFLRRRVSDR